MSEEAVAQQTRPLPCPKRATWPPPSQHQQHQKASVSLPGSGPATRSSISEQTTRAGHSGVACGLFNLGLPMQLVHDHIDAGAWKSTCADGPATIPATPPLWPVNNLPLRGLAADMQPNSNTFRGFPSPTGLKTQKASKEAFVTTDSNSFTPPKTTAVAPLSSSRGSNQRVCRLNMQGLLRFRLHVNPLPVSPAWSQHGPQRVAARCPGGPERLKTELNCPCRLRKMSSAQTPWVTSGALQHMADVRY